MTEWAGQTHSVGSWEVPAAGMIGDAGEGAGGAPGQELASLMPMPSGVVPKQQPRRSEPLARRVEPRPAAFVPPRPARAGALALPLAVGSSGLLCAAYIGLFHSGWPLAGLTSALGVIGGLFCRVMLRE